MKKCNLCGDSNVEKFYKYSNTRCKRCICDAQLERNRKNPDYLKAKNQRRRAKKLALPNTLSTKQWTDIQKRFGGKCAISNSTDIVLEHVIPLDWLHGGNYPWKCHSNG